MDLDCDSDTHCNGSTRYNQQSVCTGTGGLGNNSTTEDHTKDNIGQNNNKSL